MMLIINVYLGNTKWFISKIKLTNYQTLSAQAYFAPTLSLQMKNGSPLVRSAYVRSNKFIFACAFLKLPALFVVFLCLSFSAYHSSPVFVSLSVPTFNFRLFAPF